MYRLSRRTSWHRPSPRPASRRRALVALFTSCVTVFLAGCGGGGDTNNQGPAASSATPVRGGSLTVSVVSDLNTADPFGAAVNHPLENTRMNALYDSLVWSEPGTGRTMPQVAESLTGEPGARAWVLKLRPNVRFSDGTSYDAAAVKWTWDRHKNPESRSVVSGVAQIIERTTVVDPLTLRIELTAPNANFDRVVASSLAFVPSPTAFQKDPEGFKSNPVGAGPFTLEEWTRGNAMTLRKNPSYWQGAERPYLDKLVFKVISDSDQSVNAAATGLVDAKVSTSAVDAAKARDKGLGVTQVKGIAGESIVFNSAKPPFDDVRARRAVALALTPDGINKVAFSDQGTPATGMFPSDSPLMASGVNTNPVGDRAEAQRLLDELAAEGKPLAFTFTVPQNNQSSRTGETIQAQLSSLKNISVKVEPLAVASFVPAIRTNRTYQAALQNWLLSDPEPSMYAYLYSSGPANYLGYKNPAVDAALDQGRGTADPAQRQAAYTAMARQMAQDIPIWTYQEGLTTVYFREGTAGVLLTNDGVLLTDRIGRAAG